MRKTALQPVKSSGATVDNEKPVARKPESKPKVPGRAGGGGGGGGH